MKTSQAVGRIGKNKILNTVLSVSKRLPSIQNLNEELNIHWSGQYALDALFFKIKGQSFALLLCSDFHSLDLIGCCITTGENYLTWLNFFKKISFELKKNQIIKFFVSDGKRGLHQALKEIFPNIPLQLCNTHKQRRINQIIPQVRGDNYDKLFAYLAHKAIQAPIKEIYEFYLNCLIEIKKSNDYLSYPEPRQMKLNKVIGTLRFQKDKLHTRYYYPHLSINDPTTNHLEGINSFLKERIKLIKGFKKKENAKLLIKLLIYYYRFHKFTSSSYKFRNGKAPIELNKSVYNIKLLKKIIKGRKPYDWVRNLLSGT